MSAAAPKLKFKVQEIKEEEGLSLAFALSPDRLLQEPLKTARLAAPINVALDFSVAGSNVLLQAHVTGGWTMPCSRCLKETTAEFEADADETFPVASDSIDVEPTLRAAVLLELPQRAVCPTECKGFQSKWGEEPPAAKKSPFEILKKLKKSDH